MAGMIYGGAVLPFGVLLVLAMAAWMWRPSAFRATLVYLPSLLPSLGISTALGSP
jgi:hypothetical protein